MSKPKVSKQRARTLKKGQDKLENEEKFSKMELEKRNLQDILYKRQLEASEISNQMRAEAEKLRENREQNAKIRADHADMYAIIPRIFLHDEVAFRIHLKSIFDERKKLQAELIRKEAELRMHIKRNDELEKRIEAEIQSGETRIEAAHYRYPNVFERSICGFKDNFINAKVDGEWYQTATELHQSLKNQLLEKVPLLPPSKY